MTKQEIDKIVEECIQKTKIIYTDDGHFFSPKLDSINHLEVGNSKIINSWFTIFLEWLYALADKVYLKLNRWWHLLTPRREEICGTKHDSCVVGKLTFAKFGDLKTPIHHKRVELWARTRLFQWRKLSEGRTNQEGTFNLPFDLLAALNWWNRKNLRFEIYEITDIQFIDGKAQPNETLFQTILIPKSDLIGLEYDLGTIQLFFWEYRVETPIPRVVIKNFDVDAPEEYSHGRVVAMSEQIIPVELTKRMHLKQICLEPESINLQKIQDDYPENLTVAIEKKIPGYTRGDDWFGERFMNGMSMATFVPDKINPAHYWVKYFGACTYEVNEEYAFPSVKIEFKLKKDGLPLPLEIHLTGPLNAFNKDPFQTQIFTPADGEKWLQAKRVARVSSALCGELDQHLAGTHLNTEQYSIAAHRNLRLNPIVKLLMPHVRSVSLIDYSADKLLINGYIPRATALTAKATEQRAFDLLGFQDWSGWTPMKPISEAHTYAKAETLFWEVLREWVDIFFEENAHEIKKQWFEIYRFNSDLIQHGAPLYSSTVVWDELSEKQKQFTEERIAYLAEEYRLNLHSPRSTCNGALKAVSPVTNSPVFDENSNDWQNLKDLCCHVIMTATFMHTWVNEHQYDDIGEVLYSCLGLRFGEKEQGIMAPESDLSIAPDLTRSTQMMWFSNLLSRTEYGFIIKNEQGDMDPRFINLLYAKKDGFKKYKVEVDQIESRINI
ncbi:MAG: lipoxygenase family protein [Methylococcaceae bacterium]